MPIHDWTQVRANRFHDFHQSWTIAIRNALNSGRLPKGYFAMVEQRTGGPEPDVIALELTPPSGQRSSGGVTTSSTKPKVRTITKFERDRYARRANRLTVRHPVGNVVAVIEIVSPGNKSSRDAVRGFARKAVALLHAGIHLLIVDLFPPGRRDPQGIHKVIWDRLEDEPFTLPPDKPLTLAAYSVGSEITGYIENVAVGDELPEMPVFLTEDFWIPCPLESTYQTAWEQFPAPLRGPLVSPLSPE
jgi:hypothetical protein